MNKPMKTPHAIVSISYPVAGPVADIVRDCQSKGDRSRRLRDLLVMGQGLPSIRRSLEADLRDTQIRCEKWMQIAYRADHMNEHFELGPGGPCPLCKGLAGEF
jgi:hypothetical protein